MSAVRFIAARTWAGPRAFELVAFCFAAMVVLSACDRAANHDARSGDIGNRIGGQYARLLTRSTDLGTDTAGHVRLTAALRDATTPRALIGWAGSHGLSVRWQAGQNWAYIDGPPAAVASAFDVVVHNYRAPDGQVFYASPHQPAIPAPVRRDVIALDHILSYNGRHSRNRPPLVQDVPCAQRTGTSCRPGLSPEQLRAAYNAGPLGTTGKGQTVVLVEGFGDDGYTTADLDEYVRKYPQLGPFNLLPPINGQPGKPAGETEMDLEVVHAIAPDAQLAIIDLDHTPGDGFVETLANAFTTIDQRFPGALVSMSMTFGCDHVWTPTATLPLKNVLMAAESRGMTVFQSSGDTGGYDCKVFNAQDCTVDGCAKNPSHPEIWWSRPTDADKGVDPVASMWEVTDVGGTTLSTDQSGTWVAEESWVDVPLEQGTGGGPSALYDRPPYQATVSSPVDATHRLTPDVAADADPATGMDCYMGSTDDKGNVTASWQAGGGTSQSAPIWAGLTALMNEYLTTHGGHPVGAVNPVLYRVAAPGAARPAFHDPKLGGNAVYNAGPGYDVVTGLGTPDTDALVHDILDVQLKGQ